MTSDRNPIHGDRKRAAVDALKGYVYQLYQTAIAWIELGSEELLILEVAEDYATVSGDALNAVQVKDVTSSSTINTDGVIQAIESLLDLRERNPQFNVSVRYLSTAPIGLEKKRTDRVAGVSALESWKRLAKSGDPAELRDVLLRSKLKASSKQYIDSLEENQFREQLLRKVHFDCGAPSSATLRRLFRGRLLDLVRAEGGTHTQMEVLEASLLHEVLLVCAHNGERVLDRSDLQKIIEKAVRVSVKQADLDRQNELLSSFLSAAMPTGKSLSTQGTSSIRPIPSLPEVHVPRNKLIASAQTTLEKYGILWLHGATGMGKTLLARMIAFHVGGNWSGATLRGLDGRQSSVVLEAIADALPTLKPDGIVIDDLDDGLEQTTADAFHYLLLSADRLDIPLIVTSPYPASSKLRFAIEAGEDLFIKIPDFDEEEVGLLVRLSGGDEVLWKRYVYLACGGGHPQLAQGLIQNLKQRGWPLDELKTLASFFQENAGIEEARSECRRRLLKELPSESLLLLQRLSLHLGRFTRKLVIDVSAVPSPIASAGLRLDELIGPWIDQLDPEHLQLSPLLTNLAKLSLTESEQKSIHYAIADSHTQGQVLNADEMNAGIFSALQSQNESAATKFCIAVLQARKDQLEGITEHLDILGRLSPQTPPWPGNASLNLMFRGVQMLLCLNSHPDNLLSALNLFQSEAHLVKDAQSRATTELMIYAKLLIFRPTESTTPHFLLLVERLFALLRESDDLVPPEIKSIELLSPMLGLSLVTFAFIVQLNGIRKMQDLLEVFEFISSTNVDLRLHILAAMDSPEFDADIFVQSAWLAEDAAGTIDSGRHSRLLENLEDISKNWPRAEVAIICRKYRAIILDEYGKQSDEALRVLDDGLGIYGSGTSELMRAKAKVLYRASAYTESLRISRTLIETKALIGCVEQAFLGREAAICAERTGDYLTARNYYLYARKGAQASISKAMIPMATGLLADASLAAWHSGDRATCIDELALVLREVEGLDPTTSLRSAHVRAISQHILLWLDQEATGRIHLIDGGVPPQIYPGCVSNPEPHAEIGNRELIPIGISYYFLATIECACDTGLSITSQLDAFLSKGRILEGEGLLFPALLGRGLRRMEPDNFHQAWKGTLDELAYYRLHNDKESFNIRNVTYGIFPEATTDQFPHFEITGQLNTLLFCGFCLISESTAKKDIFIELASTSTIPPLDGKFFRCLAAGEKASNFHEGFASLIHSESERIKAGKTTNPATLCLFAYYMALVMDHSALSRHISEKVLTWYRSTWIHILNNQRFQLARPGIHAPEVESQLSHDVQDSFLKFIGLIVSTLPMTSLNDQGVMRRSLLEIRDRIRTKSGVA